MNVNEKLRVITFSPGIIAAAHRSAGDDFSLLLPVSALEKWSPKLKACLRLHDAMTAAELGWSMRIRLNEDETVLVRSSVDGDVVAIAYESRSPVVKSLSRMAKRLLRLKRVDPRPHEPTSDEASLAREREEAGQR